MTNLDLLPDEYRPKGPVNLHNLALIALSLMLAFALVMITTSLIAKSQGYTTLLSEVQTQMIPYRRQYKDIRVAQDKLQTLEERLPLIEDLIKQRILWSHRLDDINEMLSREDLWLETVNAELPGQSAILASTTASAATTGDSQIEMADSYMPWLRVSGWAKELPAISRFLRALEQIPGFEAPTFITTQEMEVEGRTLLSFEFKVRLVELGSVERADSNQPETTDGI